jgi:pyruvate formate lyase activating enzyme
LKAFTDDFYKSVCKARLEPVKDTLKLMKKLDILVEVTTLLIPGLNDNPDELAQLAGFIKNELGPETPWHVSRFHPTYRLTDRPATPLETLLEARTIGLDSGLHYVYVGNVPGEKGESTFCHGCGSLLIERRGFAVETNRVEAGKCPWCGQTVFGVGM